MHLSGQKPFLHEIGCDLHVHVLPGIDDGSPDLMESMQILEAHYEAGIRRVIATPHIRSDFFQNTRQTIYDAWALLHEQALQRWPDLRLTYAAEHFADDYLLQLIESDKLLPLFDRYVLIETSMRVEQPYFMEIVERLIEKNWKPVLAHPERYRPWHQKPDRYAQLREMQVIFQVNLLSLGGMYGAPEQRMAEQLIQKGWIGAVGTDLHRVSQFKYLRKAAQNPAYGRLCSVSLLNHQLLKHEARN
ncbi:tyrosine-protein phosphatase [Arundinibacter roseus]|uniref:protein-tyrosine-phosphatase n=1 Tax=Arundinibacter roseus TaxID=2070510 RepID=A0A4R4KBA0_9BACT|nr:CpsB/CapC family capsule biosynthesis tyrosine phosphatase [Arundinibacter roseus]TDB63459.1 hypothetical protein EZE20_17005 [Arundinibacter roseus]